LEFANVLLAWYDLNARKLPWRGSRDPYVIWVSEIIFQQTRIEQGMDYFLRFIERFPTLDSLARADQDTVLRFWQGLGYYSRARNLLFTARQVMDELGGEFPRQFESIRNLKGIGDYTASCIASICFGQPHAAVDGNVYRVLSRIYADKTPVDTQKGRIHFKSLAQQLIHPGRPGDFNEAMMDLGATVCKPRTPACHSCPVSHLCRAYETGNQTGFPVKGPSLKRSGSVLNYFLVRSKNQLFIQRRQGKGIWEGLYELPLVSGEMQSGQLVAEYRELYGQELISIEEIQRVRHILSHTELDIRFYSAVPASGDTPSSEKLLPVTVEQSGQYPFPKPLVDFLGKIKMD
jgi:A/G-specific adenine glycosylase